MKKLLIVAAALMAGTAALAQTQVAQPAPAAPPPPMAHPAPMPHPMSDKAMTRDEMVAMVREHFSKLDGNKDGAVTREETMDRHMKMGEHARLGEGAQVWREDPMGDPNAAFDRIDADKNGQISREEFAKAREQRIERRIVMKQERKDAKEGPAKDGRDARKHGYRMHRMGGMGGARMIVMADTDKDGRVTLAEAEALALRHFDEMDANHDGQVTPEERRAARPMIIKKVIEEKKTAS